MIKIKDRYGVEQECLYIMETPSYQPKTQEVFWNVMAVGYDGIRRTTLFMFENEQEMHRKYMELREQHLKQFLNEVETKIKEN